MNQLTSIENCFAKGLLKKTVKSKILASQDIKQAEFFLGESLDLVRFKKKEMAAIALYNAVFHAGRALLFRDGIKERSQYCLQKYLEEKYQKPGLLSGEEAALFDVLRGIRQEVQYGVTKIRFEENIAELCDKTEKFIEKTKVIIRA